MNRTLSFGIGAAIGALAIWPSAGSSQSHQDHPHLHVSDRWEDCSFQLDPSLTRQAWRQFTREAGLVTYFRPLRDAAPMGRGNFEISVTQSTVGIDDHDAAWNDTFVHPDSTHWLYEGSGLNIPGVMGRAGVTDRIDVGFYFTKNPRANYGVAGGQLQYNFIQQASAGVDASARASLVTLFGPDDVDVTVYHTDLVVSRQFALFNRVALAPYVGVAGYLSTAQEKSAVVDLDDARMTGIQAMAGAVAQVSILRFAVEYNAASVNSTSLKVGVAF
jgi:hypothetical protein